MDLLLVPVPLFDSQSVVDSYLFRYRIANQTAQPDPGSSPLLQALNSAGDVDAFTGGKSLFVPVDHRVLLAEPERQCRQTCSKIILFLENKIPDNDEYWSVLPYLRQMGFRFAMPSSLYPEGYGNILGYIDYLVINDKHPRLSRAERISTYKRISRTTKIVATGLTTPADYEKAIKDGADLFEGQFYYMPLSKGEGKITPLKANLIHLLNVVRDENFEFSTISNIVQRDPALSYSLMRFVNSPFLGIRNKIKTIRHAVTILGQDEVRKWVTAAVFRSLGAEHPSELVRLSLVRAKFAENLAPSFKLQIASQSLFLMGLFSALDVMLNTTMRAALDTVNVSDEIRNALLEREGPYYKILELMDTYERADWDAVLSLLDQYRLAFKDIYHAYIEAISWYNELISDRVRPLKRY